MNNLNKFDESVGLKKRKRWPIDIDFIMSNQLLVRKIFDKI